MAWDDDKSTATDPDNPAPDEQLTASEWDAHVADQKSHASRHSDGGTDELDVSDLAGGAGTADQVATTDGTAVSWSDIVLAMFADSLDTAALDGSQGTDGQVWTSTGTGGQWESVAAGSLTAAEKRQRAYENGPSISVPTSNAQSASSTGSDAEYVEESMPLLDGWEIEIVAAGAWDKSGSATSTAEVLHVPTANVTDETQYTSFHSTNDTNAISTDGSGNVDFTTTLATHQNTSGAPQRIFFRAINSDSASSEVPVGGAWVVVRKEIP